ncbi:alpha/beta hydrolase [Oleiagrimonas sp.]|jgi:abhydrolase domain-containing protein 6|uniref:alpha/beta fold hydrolase n=1 Tax=Oleiagrimonas sp. TaxID=2010330 RepID=UPI00260D86E7|nr:alpha/beta hydrolase [Oleiagrimonas sp.]MDA3915008.1 alpha/beta hydrolase [Oleiagrimonas sp.]
MISSSTADRPLWKRLLLRRLKMLLVLVGLVVVFGGGTYLFAPQWLMQLNTWRQAERAGLDSHHLKVGDTDWTYYEGGSGPTMLLLHGYGVGRSDWLKVAPFLTDHFHVIIPDLPGWGDSTRNPADNYDISHQAKRLYGFVHTLELKPFVLVGHSMGGAIAGTYASEHPDSVSGLVLMDSFGLKFVKNDFAREALSGNNPLTFHDRAGLERVLRLVYGQPPKIPGRFMDVIVARERHNASFLDKVYKELLKPSQYTILDNRLDKLSMPVLGIWCRDDKVIDISALNTLRDGLTHAPSISASVLNKCGHVPEQEKPEETARILSGFAIAH